MIHIMTPENIDDAVNNGLITLEQADELREQWERMMEALDDVYDQAQYAPPGGWHKDNKPKKP